VTTFSLANRQNAPLNAPLNASLNAPLNQLQNSILEEIRFNSKISYDELADKFSKNRTTIMRNIQKLKALGFIERVGSDKSGYWRVKR
jgi:ATP-dependent DNA helicase RecG